MKRQILRKVSEFFQSDLYKDRSRAKDKEGGRLRYYKSQYKKDKLSEIAALSLLLDFGIVKEISYIDIK